MAKLLPPRANCPAAHNETVANHMDNVTEIVNATVGGKTAMNGFTVLNHAGETLYDGAPGEEALTVFRENFERLLTSKGNDYLGGLLPILKEGHQRLTQSEPTATEVIR